MMKLCSKLQETNGIQGILNTTLVVGDFSAMNKKRLQVDITPFKVDECPSHATILNYHANNQLGGEAPPIYQGKYFFSFILLCYF
jgi:hypothetical protein